MWRRRRAPRAGGAHWQCPVCGHELRVVALGHGIAQHALDDAITRHALVCVPYRESTMPATVHPLAVPPRAEVSRVRYDSASRRWTVTVDELRPDDLPPDPQAIPSHVHDALHAFASRSR